MALALTATKLYAQPGFDDDVEDTPLDGGIALLVAGGLVYGYKKASSFKK